MTEQQAKETIRLSVGEGLTKRMVRLAAQEMCKIVLQTQNPRAVFSDYPINVEVK